jgi:16S rRNA G527 N7-methylase RsmG
MALIQSRRLENVREYIKRSMITMSSRIRFLKACAQKLPTRNAEEVRHAIEVFSQARWKVSKRTARRYAEQILQLLNIAEDEKSPAQPLTEYLKGEE